MLHYIFSLYCLWFLGAFFIVINLHACTLQAKCPLNHPPGNEIYRKANLSCFEIDGRKNKVCKMWAVLFAEILY